MKACLIIYDLILLNTSTYFATFYSALCIFYVLYQLYDLRVQACILHEWLLFIIIYCFQKYLFLEIISMIILYTLNNMKHKILDNLLESIVANDS